MCKYGKRRSGANQKMTCEKSALCETPFMSKKSPLNKSGVDWKPFANRASAGGARAN